MPVLMHPAYAAFLALSVTVAASAPALAKDPPSATELIRWTTCLKSAGLDASGGRSPDGMEKAFGKCSAEEQALRGALARDPYPRPTEYNVERMKSVLRAQQRDPK